MSMTQSTTTIDSAAAENASAPEADVIAQLAGIPATADSPLAQLRAQRPEATRHAQGSYRALFDPAEAGGLTPVERFATALYVATVHGAREAAAHYRQRLIRVGAGPEIVAQAEAAGGSRPAAPSGGAAATRLQALLAHADLLATRPSQARPDHLQSLAGAGLSTQEIVTLAQTIAFVSFQVRVVAGLRLLGRATDREAPFAAAAANGVGAAASPAPAGVAPAARVLRPDASLARPKAFTVEQLEWAPWLEPLALEDATPQQAAALEGSRGNSRYFRLLAYNVDVLTERTATDKGIFYTPGGARRAERELSAAATSRLNGCIYCASVHARLAAQLSKRTEDVDRLLRDGVAPGTDLHLDERWTGVVAVSVALASTPPTATTEHVERLRQIGLSDLEILDVMQAGAFFAWANRLMLTLGEPYYPKKAES